MTKKIITLDNLKYYNNKISNYVDEKVFDAVDNLELDELNAILVDTDAEADDPIVPDYVTETELETALSGKMDKVTLAIVATSGSYNDLTNKPTIPSAVTESTVSGWGFTKNTGTITGIIMNGTSKGTSGVVDLGTVITAHQDISGKADDNEVVHKNGTETITGVKTFNSGVHFLGSGDSNAVTLSTNTRINVNGTTKTVLGFGSGTFYINHGDYSLLLRGKNTRPTYNSSELALFSDVNNKQDNLVSGTNIKTINGTSLLGSGNITIEGGSGGGSGAYSEVSHGTSDTTFILTPNVFHVWDEVASLTLTLGDETVGVANEFLFQFNSGSTATTLTLPDTIKWVNDSAPTIEANKIYQISILKGLASVLEFDNAPQVSLITFDCVVDSLIAEEGMTWEQWCDSKYNDGKYFISISGVHRNETSFLVAYQGTPVSTDDVIINGAFYMTTTTES